MITAAHSRFVTGRMLPTRKTEDLLLGLWELSQQLGRVPRRLLWDNEPGIGRGQRRAEGVASFMGTRATKLVLLRMGHDSMHAALIYQHTTTRADRLIATALDAEVRRATKRKDRQTRPRSERSDSAPNGNRGEAISAPGSLADRPQVDRSNRRNGR